MKCITPWAALALVAAPSVLRADDTLKQSLVHGVFKASPEAGDAGGPPILPLVPAQKITSVEGRATFRITGGAAGEGASFPVLAGPESREAVALAELMDDGATFVAAVDLTGSGVSDLLMARKGMGGWKVLTNGQRLAKPVQAFLVGFYEKGAGSARTDTIPADLGDLTVDQDLLAATGDFLGNGTEQLAYTRPGASQMWVVGAHGVATMRADLKGVEATPAGPRTHFLFAFKAATHRVQHTRLAYYRMGCTDLLRLVPKGMEFHAERVPLKGNWERLNQEVLDWPAPAAPGGDKAAQEGKTEAK
jgi:hypothetical protein